MLILIIIGFCFFKNSYRESILIFNLLVLKLFLKPYNSIHQISLLSKKQGKILSTINSKSVIFSVIISLFFVKYGIISLLIFYLILEIFRFYYCSKLKNKIKLKFFRLKSSSSLFSKSTNTDILTFIEVNIDSLFIGSFIGSSSLGVYNFASNFSEKIRKLLNSSISKYIYRIYGESDGDITRISSYYLKVNYFTI